MPRRWPVPLADRFFLLFEGVGPPVACCWTFEVDGEPPDPQRLRESFAAALARHPRATARLVVDGSAWGAWEETPDAAARIVHVHDGAGDVAATVDALMARPWDLANGPLVELHWFPTARRLALRFHHALADGYGALGLLGDLFAAARGEALPAPVEPPPPPAPPAGWMRRLAAFFWRRTRAARFAVPDRLYDAGRRPAGRQLVAVRELPAAPLRDAAKRRNAGFTDLLVAAWALAAQRYKAERGQRLGTLRVMVNQGLRPAGDVTFDNRSAAVPVWVRPEDRADREALVAACAAQSREAREGGIAEAMGGLSGLLGLRPALARALVLPAATRPTGADSLVVSNLGRLPPGLALGRAGVVRAVASARAPEGTGMICLAVAAGDALSLALCHHAGILEPAEATRLLALVGEELDAYVGTA